MTKPKYLQEFDYNYQYKCSVCDCDTAHFAKIHWHEKQVTAFHPDGSGEPMKAMAMGVIGYCVECFVEYGGTAKIFKEMNAMSRSYDPWNFSGPFENTKKVIKMEPGEPPEEAVKKSKNTKEYRQRVTESYRKFMTDQHKKVEETRPDPTSDTFNKILVNETPGKYTNSIDHIRDTLNKMRPKEKNDKRTRTNTKAPKPSPKIPNEPN